MASTIALPVRGLRLAARAPILANPLNLVALALIAVFAFCALFAPLIAPYDPLLQDLGSRLMPPSLAHWLGTDSLGRDIASRILYGARISLIIGVVVVASAGVFGTVVGLVAGYAGGLVDEALMRLTEVFLAFPALILAMAIAGALGPSLTNAIIAIAAVTWAVYARLTRGQILSLRRREFVEAARAIGASWVRILWHHLLPNVLAPLMIQASFDLGSAIIAAAGLSFIGFGAQPPTPEWGVMISEGRNYINTQPWLSLFPGLAILLAVGAAVGLARGSSSGSTAPAPAGPRLAAGTALASSSRSSEAASVTRSHGVIVGHAVTATIRSAAPCANPKYPSRKPYWDHILRYPTPRIAVIEDLDDPPVGAASNRGSERETRRLSRVRPRSETSRVVRATAEGLGVALLCVAE